MGDDRMELVGAVCTFQAPLAGYSLLKLDYLVILGFQMKYFGDELKAAELTISNRRGFRADNPTLCGTKKEKLFSIKFPGED